MASGSKRSPECRASERTLNPGPAEILSHCRRSTRSVAPQQICAELRAVAGARFPTRTLSRHALVRLHISGSLPAAGLPERKSESPYARVAVRVDPVRGNCARLGRAGWQLPYVGRANSVGRLGRVSRLRSRPVLVPFSRAVLRRRMTSLRLVFLG